MYANSKKVFTRNISVSCFEDGEESVIVEGEIKDDRLCRYYLVTGERRPPGILHHMRVTMRVSSDSLIISDINIAMIQYPREECADSNHNIHKLNGLSISKGFTSTVKKIIGGTNGCAHVVSCLLAMAPAAVQGYWANKAQRPLSKEFSKYGTMNHYLKDTCYVWRSDSPIFKKFEESFNDEAGTSQEK